jgi:hypothetical protein
MTKTTRFFHESETQFTPKFIDSIVQKYGQNILIGGDPGHSEEFERAMSHVDKRGALKHVYLVGPGMMEWSKEEAAEIKANARSIGIDVRRKTWKDEWFTSGWITKCEEWFTTYGAMNFYSAEIDNIDAALKNDPMKLLNFYNHLMDFCIRNSIKMKLMVKNLSEEELKILETTPRLQSFLCEFGMFEAGSGDPKKQTKLAASLGIQAVTPLNGLRKTEDYGTTREGVPNTVK